MMLLMVSGEDIFPTKPIHRRNMSNPISWDHGICCLARSGTVPPQDKDGAGEVASCNVKRNINHPQNQKRGSITHRT